MKVEKKPLAEITTRAIEVLSKELGSCDAIRFFNQFTTGRGNYTLERDRLFEGITLDQILEEINESRGSSASSQGPS